MATFPLSALERNVVEAFHRIYGYAGFPQPDDVSVSGRRNTGSGRYVDVLSHRNVDLPDGHLDMSGHYVHMDEVPNGLMAVALIAGKRLRQLELATYGGFPWDGTEYESTIV